MTVYVLTIDFVDVDSGDFNVEVQTFDTIDKAMTVMVKEMDTTKKQFEERCDVDQDNFVDGDMSWSIWEKENYPSYHCDFKITECQVQ